MALTRTPKASFSFSLPNQIFSSQLLQVVLFNIFFLFACGLFYQKVGLFFHRRMQKTT